MTTPYSPIEEFLLAPDDPAWDERERDEFYRAATIGWTALHYASLILAAVVAIVGPYWLGILALLPMSVGSWAMIWYLNRRGIDLRTLTKRFSRRYRITAYGTQFPLLAVCVVALTWHAINFDKYTRSGMDGSTIAGAAVGAAIGGIGMVAITRIIARRQVAKHEPDDEF